jgi:S1-C subfamily serine protease
MSGLGARSLDGESRNRLFDADSEMELAAANLLLAEAADSRLKSGSRSITVSIPTLKVEQVADPKDLSAYSSKSAVANFYLDAKRSVVEIDGKRELKNGGLSPLRARGTGFVATDDGRIATMLHVVDDLQALSVRTAEGKTYPARVVASDDATDLAVLKISSFEKSGLRPLELGWSNNLQPGAQLSTFSFPQGWNKMYYSPGRFESAGSLKDMQPQYREMLGAAENGWQRVLGITAHAEKGSSGAPVLNEFGRVVGITDFANGKSKMLAVPVEALKQVLYR